MHENQEKNELTNYRSYQRRTTRMKSPIKQTKCTAHSIKNHKQKKKTHTKHMIKERVQQIITTLGCSVRHNARRNRV